MPSIYAIGDVTDRVKLTPVAIREGMAFVETVFGGKPTAGGSRPASRRRSSPSPRFGTVGLTEEAGRASSEPIEVYCTSFRPMQTAFAGAPTAC